MSRPERKSRRTHKNSRDGCPNCKAKRIKCTEELPQCHNCVRKNQRCGYLDFPQERLEMIRKKNDRKQHSVLQTPHIYNMSRIEGKDHMFDASTPHLMNSHLLTPGLQESLSPAFAPVLVPHQGHQHDLSPVEFRPQILGHRAPRNSLINQEQSHQQSAGHTQPSQSGTTTAVSSPLNPNPPSVSVPISCSSTQPVESPAQQSIIATLQPTNREPLPPQHTPHMQQISSLNPNQNSQDQLGVEQNELSYEQRSNSDLLPQGHLSHLNFINGSLQHPPEQQIQLYGPNYNQISNSNSSIGKEVNQCQQTSESQFPQSTYNSGFERQQPTTSNSVVSELQFDVPNYYSVDSTINYSHFKDMTFDAFDPEWVKKNYTSPKSYAFSQVSAPPYVNILPNGKYLQISFPKIHVVDRLKNRFLERFLKHFRSDLKHMNNLEFRNVAPVWNYRIAENFWTSVYNQAEVLNLYFSFFLDRSLNALIKRCSKSIDDENFLATEPLLSSLIKKYTPPQIFTKKQINSLTQKSYTYYGHLIKDLRQSLTRIHSEYPAKISLFAAWSTFLNLHSSVETFCLLFSGTTALFSEVFDGAQMLNQIPPTLNTGFYIFVNHSSASLIPVYDFSVIKELYQDLVEFQEYSRNRAARITDDDKHRILEDIHVARQVYDLKVFLEKLINVYYPRICEVNRKSKEKTQRNSNGICYVEVRVFYDLLCHWFNIYPSEAIPMGPNFSATWKTFYLYFPAIGKALTNILTPIRSLMLVDPCNTFCPRTDFNFEVYKIDTEASQLSELDYMFYRKQSEKLLRVISYFNSRILFYSYYLSTVTVLDSEYIRGRPDLGFSGEVLEILPNQLDVDEKFVTSFDNNVSIKAENYPVMEFFREELWRIIDGQQQSDQKGYFNYKTGLYSSDFNPEKWIELIKMRQQQAWEEERTTIQQSQIRMHNVDMGRQEVYKSVSKI